MYTFFVFHVYPDREETQRAALRVYKEQGDDIGIPFKLDPKRLLVLRKFRINKSNAGQPPKKQLRVNKETSNESGDEFKELDSCLDTDPDFTKKTTTNFSQQSNKNKNNTKSNNRSNKNKNLPKQFRFKEDSRLVLFSKCIEANIMSLSPRFRNKKFAKIWNELILEDNVWALATLQRVIDEFYSKQNNVLKLLKNKKEHQIVRDSDKKLLKYVKEQDLLTETLHFGDNFSLVFMFTFF